MAIYDINGNEIISGGSTATALNYDVVVKGINHRGYNYGNDGAPENTLPAFKLSKANGFQYVETDVRFTSDGVAVILHDETINRTARNADGTELSSDVNIADITYEQAQVYDFGVYKASKYAGTKIPTFEQFLSLCRSIGLYPYVELKTGTEVQIKSIVDLIHKYGFAKTATYISFTSSYLGYVVAYDAKARVGWLASPSASNVTSAAALKTGSNEVFFDESLAAVTEEKAARCRDNGFGLEIYTADNTDPVIYANPYVTGITSNRLVAGKVLYDAVMS